MKIKVGKHHEMKNGHRCYVGYYFDNRYYGHYKPNNIIEHMVWDKSGQCMGKGHGQLNIISEWQEQETFNVGDMWVILQFFMGGDIECKARLYESRAAALKHVACGDQVMTSSDWEACKRGERELIVGEGLDG